MQDQYTFLHFILMEAFTNPDAVLPGSTTSKLKGPQDPKILQRVNAEFEVKKIKCKNPTQFKWEKFKSSQQFITYFDIK